ncbi:MAG: hypothetical protein ACYTDX_06475, partial [Planctomycetota bacterium]
WFRSFSADHHPYLILDIADPSAADSLAAVEVVSLTFGWPVGLDLDVTEHRLKAKTSSPGTMDSTSTTTRYRMTLDDHEEGFLVDFSHVDAAALPATSGPQEAMEAMTGNFRPDYIVSAEGDLLGLHNFDDLLDIVLAALKPTLESMERRIPQWEQWIQNTLTEEFFYALALDIWGPMVYNWAGVDMEVGVTYTTATDQSLPVYPDALVPYTVEDRLEGRVPCPGQPDRYCVRIVRTGRMDSEATRAVLNRVFLEGLRERADLDMTIEALDIYDTVTVVTEPDGLVPHSLEIVRVTIATVRGASDGPTRAERLDRREFHFRRAELTPAPVDAFAAALEQTSPPSTPDSLTALLGTLLLGPDDVGGSATTASEGTPGPDDIDLSLDAEPTHALQRTLTGANGLIHFGSSKFVILQTVIGAYASRPQAQQSLRIMALTDVAAWLPLMSDETASAAGEVKQVDVESVGDIALAWILPLSMNDPSGMSATLDMVIGVVARGRISAALMAVGLQGQVAETDVHGLLATIDRRLRERPDAFEPDAFGATEVAPPSAEALIDERRDGIVLDTIFHPLRTVPGVQVTQSRYFLSPGAVGYYLAMWGEALTFPVGASDVLHVEASATLFEDEVRAIQAGMEHGTSPPHLTSLGGDDFGPDLDLTDRPLAPAPEGSYARAARIEVRGVIEADAVSIVVVLGRVVVTVELFGAPGSLRYEDLRPMVEDVRTRLLATAPEASRSTFGPDQVAAVERAMEAEDHAVTLAKDGDFPAALLLADSLTGAGARVRGATWQSLCWYGLMDGFAEQAAATCDAALAEDSLHVARRSNRAILRALTGDLAGAIADLEYAVEFSDDYEWKIRRERWRAQLKEGKDPFTEEALAELRPIG